MKSKISLKSFVNYLTLSLFAIGTVISIVYLFVGHQITVYLSLIAFSLGFCFLTISLIRNAMTYADKHKRIAALSKQGKTASDHLGKEFLEDLDSEKGDIQKNAAKKRNYEIIKAVFAGIFAIFTIIVMLLY